MYTNAKATFGALLTGVLLCIPLAANGAESTSYRLYDDPGNTAVAGPMESTSYRLQGDTGTWRALPGVSTNYQIVLAQTPSSSSSSSSSSVSSTAGTSDGVTGGIRDSGGGRRGGGVRGIFTLPEPTHSAAPGSIASRGTRSSSTSDAVPASAEPSVKPNVFREIDFLAGAHAPQAVRRDGSSTSRSAVSGYEDPQYFILPDTDQGASSGSRTSPLAPLAVAFVAGALLSFAVLFGTAPSGFISACIPFRIRRWLLPILFTQKRKIGRWKMQSASRKRRNKSTAKALAIALLLTSVCSHAVTVRAATTAPQRIVYNGHLLDSNGSAVTTAVSVRFSFWNSADYVSGDVTGTGAVNTAASTYASWNEVHTVTPNSQGFFSLEMGSTASLPDFSAMSTATLLSLYLQVEVKASSSAVTSYELLDFDTSSTTSDRSPMRSVPFALNADFVDKREVGTGSGNIAILERGAIFNPARIPGGTNSGTFLIDYDGSETSSVALQFGKTLGKSLSYSGSNALFNFNSNLRVQGDLTVTGLINGISLSTVAGNAPLKVSSGAGLAVIINAGSYRLNGSITNFTGSSSVTLTNNTTNYVFFGSGGLKVSSGGFPSDESVIRLAQVVTSGGAITAVSDRRVTSSDDRERTVEEFLHAAFSRAAYKADGSSNVGQLSVSHDSTTKRNYYLWTSTRSTLQDYDVYLRVSLGSDFVGWVDNPLQVTYRTSSGSTSANTLGIAVYDTAGTAVTLSGSVTSLASATWATTQMEFTGTPTFTAGQDILIKFTMAAKSNAEVHLAEVKIQQRELLQ